MNNLFRCLSLFMLTLLFPRRVLSSVVSSSRKVSMSATFGAGCFWGTEKFFKDKFGDVIVNGKVGYMGPSENMHSNPSYRMVSEGTSGFVEVYDFQFTAASEDRANEHYRNMVRYFFQFHDPTTMNQQGNDRGTQYASVIFVHDALQRKIASSVMEELQQTLTTTQETSEASSLNIFGNTMSVFGSLTKGRGIYANPTITTAVVDATTFYPAEAEHQDYLNIHVGGYCNHRHRFDEWPAGNGKPDASLPSPSS